MVAGLQEQEASISRHDDPVRQAYDRVIGLRRRADKLLCQTFRDSDCGTEEFDVLPHKATH